MNYKYSKEFAREKWGRLVASIILKNNRFGGPTHFDRRIATFGIFHLHQAISWWEKGRAWDFYLAHRLEKYLKTSVFSNLLKD